MNLLHYVHHKYTEKYQWLRVGNCKELFSLGDTCQQAWFNSSTGFALDMLRHILNISQMPSISIEEEVCPPCLFVGRLSLKSKSSREKEGKVRQTLREHCNGNKLEILQLILGKPEGNPKTNKNLLPDPQLEAFCSTHAAPSFSFVEPGVPYNP